jgi:hypothetical protein
VVLIGAEFVPVPVAPERGWFGAPVCSAPDFIEPGLTLPGGGAFCAEAADIVRRPAAAIIAILLIIMNPFELSWSDIGAFAPTVVVPTVRQTQRSWLKQILATRCPTRNNSVVVQGPSGLM